MFISHLLVLKYLQDFVGRYNVYLYVSITNQLDQDLQYLSKKYLSIAFLCLMERMVHLANRILQFFSNDLMTWRLDVNMITK